MSSEKYKWKVWDCHVFSDGRCWELWANDCMVGLVSRIDEHVYAVAKCSEPGQPLKRFTSKRFTSMRQGALELVRHLEEGS